MLYADDIALLAETESDLQELLDSLQDWREQNGLCVNSEKKVVHFHPTSVHQTETKFRYDGSELKLTPSYRYLGFTLNEHMDYSKSVSLVVQSASRAFGSVITKCKSQGGLPFITYTKLFDSLVWSVVGYSAPIWGFKEFAYVNKLHNQACRYFLGVCRYTPTPVVRADLGWRTPYQKQWIVFQLLFRFLKMKN